MSGAGGTGQWLGYAWRLTGHGARGTGQGIAHSSLLPVRIQDPNPPPPSSHQQVSTTPQAWGGVNSLMPASAASPPRKRPPLRPSPDGRPFLLVLLLLALLLMSSGVGFWDLPSPLPPSPPPFVQVIFFVHGAHQGRASSVRCTPRSDLRPSR